MTSSDSDPATALKERIWRGGFLVVLVAAAFTAGYTVGSLRPDVVALRAKITELQSRISDLEIETSWPFRTTKQAYLLAVCEKELATRPERLGEPDVTP